jgi:hypothetical protein
MAEERGHPLRSFKNDAVGDTQPVEAAHMVGRKALCALGREMCCGDQLAHLDREELVGAAMVLVDQQIACAAMQEVDRVRNLPRHQVDFGEDIAAVGPVLAHQLGGIDLLVHEARFYSASGLPPPGTGTSNTLRVMLISV